MNDVPAYILAGGRSSRFGSDKARAILDAGATACAYFTGFITRGPLLARSILDALLEGRR